MLDHQDLSAVQAAAQTAVQLALGNGVSVTAIERWGGGAHNTGFQLPLDDGMRLFMKIEKEDIFPRTRRCQIEREVYGIGLAAQAGLDVPEIVGYDFTGQTAGCRYLLETFIDRDLLGMAVEKLSEGQRAALMEEFQHKAEQIYAIRGAAFGELYPGGWLGQYDTWREMVMAFSDIMLEDAGTLGYYSAQEMAVLRDAHTIALDAILYGGCAILTHNDLHIYNAFVEPKQDGLRVGKVFDFSLSLFQAGYLACFGQYGFSGKEAEVARRFNVTESELRGYELVSDREFVNFTNAIRFAPDQPYGYLARRRDYLAACQAFLAVGT